MVRPAGLSGAGRENEAEKGGLSDLGLEEQWWCCVAGEFGRHGVGMGTESQALLWTPALEVVCIWSLLVWLLPISPPTSGTKVFCALDTPQRAVSDVCCSSALTLPCVTPLGAIFSRGSSYPSV